MGPLVPPGSTSGVSSKPPGLPQVGAPRYSPVATAMSCYSCDQNLQLDALQIREAILVQDGWRIAHAFNSALPGWLVLVPLRHLYALDELDRDESQALGDLLRRATRALRRVTGCEKTYAMSFSEAEGFRHLHVHLVPRMKHFDASVLGAKSIEFLQRPTNEQVSDPDQDWICGKLRSALSEDS